MNKTEPGRWALWLSFPLAVLLAVASLGGLFVASTYANETRVYAAQGVGDDALNLIVVLPVLLIGAVLALRGSLAARLVWMGTLVYLVYDFIYYTLAVHFNALFLVYCAILGLSFYASIGILPALSVTEIAHRYGTHAPATATAILFLLMVAGAGAHWLQETVPALISRGVPRNVLESGLLTDPAAVLDMALLLPALTVTAVLLLRRQQLAFVLAPVLLAFSVLIALLITAMGVVMALRGFGADYGGFLVNITIAVAAAALLALFLRPETKEA